LNVLNPQHRARYNDNAGHFGYFDCEPNAQTGAALLQHAETWLRGKGAQKMIGPSSHSVNEESGLLIDGFEHPNVLMMPFGRPDYMNMFEAAGLSKAIDLLAFQADLAAGFTPGPFMRRLRKIVDDDPQITFRTLDMSWP